MLNVIADELRAQRRHVEQALEGLSQSALWSAHPPTTWTPVAVVHHLALYVERWWFSAIVAGEENARRYFDAHPGGAWSVPEGTDVFALYREEQATADRILRSARPQDPPQWWPEFLGRPQNVGQIALHVATETAAHAGQLDVVRESIDGKQWLVLD